MAAVALTVLFLIAGAGKARVVDRAAVLAARGELAVAGQLLEPLVASSNPGALFVRACIALEESNLAAASRFAEQLASSRSGAPEVVVLARLIEERKRAPEDRWTDVAARAWSASGRPMRATKQLLGVIDVQRPIDPTAIAHVQGRGDRLLLEFGRAPAGSAGLIEAAFAEADGVERSLGVHLVAMHVLLHEKMPEKKRTRARSAALDLLDAMARSHPDDGYLASGAVLLRAGAQAPLTVADLASLEEALERNSFALPVRPLFDAFRAAYAQVDPGQAHSRAFSETARALPLDIHVVLSQRVAATSDSALRDRAAAVLAVAGARLEAGATLLERMIGLSLQMKGARLRGDAEAIEVVGKKRARLTGLMANGNAFWSYQWPIASLWRDHFVRNTTDEVGYYELLSR